MTDVIRPANGQAANAESSGNAWQDPHGTPGYDAAIGERTLMASESGEARAWPKRPGPGAESPAGRFLPTDGEAAPPFRSGMEPARSDETTEPPNADDDDRGGWRPQPAPAYPALALWPWSFPIRSRQIPVVGPTEALRGRAGSTGTGMAVPPDAVAVPPDPAQPSSWQQAQEGWQGAGGARGRAPPPPARPGSALQRAAGPGGMAGAGGRLGAHRPRAGRHRARRRLVPRQRRAPRSGRLPTPRCRRLADQRRARDPRAGRLRTPRGRRLADPRRARNPRGGRPRTPRRRRPADP